MANIPISLCLAGSEVRICQAIIFRGFKSMHALESRQKAREDNALLP